MGIITELDGDGLSQLVLGNNELEEERADIVEIKQIHQVAVHLIVDVLQVLHAIRTNRGVVGGGVRTKQRTIAVQDWQRVLRDRPAHDVFIKRLHQVHWGDLAVHQRFPWGDFGMEYKMSTQRN